MKDPVEYVLSGINQVQVNDIVGLHFATAFGSGCSATLQYHHAGGNSSDIETASIAINASLTGHLVFSTLHTIDAPGAVTRLIDIGVKPFLGLSDALPDGATARAQNLQEVRGPL